MSGAAKTPIFVTGVTGYIGGAVLARLLNHPAANTFDINVLVRNASKAQILQQKFNVRTLVATHADYDKIEAAVEESHAVFHIADADDVGLAQAIVRGLQKRHAKAGDLPIYIHTSGTGVLTDDARGLHTTDVIYDDLNVDQIRDIPPTAFHRNVDLIALAADEQGFARTYIILPSTIYGVAQNELVAAGVSNSHSIQIPGLIKASLPRKRAGVVGKGTPFWPDVHVDDIADLFIVVFDAAVADKAGHGKWEGYYFGENGEHTWLQISEAIGQAFVELGIATDATPTTFTTEELIKYFGSEEVGNYSGSNSRCRANRGKALGWKPKKTTEDMLKSIKPEVEAIWRQQQQK